MLLKLSTRGLRALACTSQSPILGRVTTDTRVSDEATGRAIHLAVSASDGLPNGFRAYLVRAAGEGSSRPDVFVLGPEHEYVGDRDVVRIEPTRGYLTTLYRASSAYNTFLVTERCDNLCVMCSQPPKEHDDSWLVDDLFSAIPLIEDRAGEIGITGGEPALLGERLVELLCRLRDHLPRKSVHVLSNGRRFGTTDLARRLGTVRHSDLMVGVPVYSDVANEHDYVVQAQGAFDETIRGILNLKRAGVRVEIRFVVHADTVGRLREFATFVARNLTFVDHVALMGLEPVGYARLNLPQLWVDPVDYQGPLREAVAILARAGMMVSIYNHQLCTLDPILHKFARKSISEWKNYYLEECAACGLRAECGGFFASATIRHSRGIARQPARSA